MDVSRNGCRGRGGACAGRLRGPLRLVQPAAARSATIRGQPWNRRSARWTRAPGAGPGAGSANGGSVLLTLLLRLGDPDGWPELATAVAAAADGNPAPIGRLLESASALQHGHALAQRGDHLRLQRQCPADVARPAVGGGRGRPADGAAVRSLHGRAGRTVHVLAGAGGRARRGEGRRRARRSWSPVPCGTRSRPTGQVRSLAGQLGSATLDQLAIGPARQLPGECLRQRGGRRLPAEAGAARGRHALPAVTAVTAAPVPGLQPRAAWCGCCCRWPVVVSRGMTASTTAAGPAEFRRAVARLDVARVARRGGARAAAGSGQAGSVEPRTVGDALSGRQRRGDGLRPDDPAVRSGRGRRLGRIPAGRGVRHLRAGHRDRAWTRCCRKSHGAG